MNTLNYLVRARLELEMARNCAIQDRERALFEVCNGSRRPLEMLRVAERIALINTQMQIMDQLMPWPPAEGSDAAG